MSGDVKTCKKCNLTFPRSRAGLLCPDCLRAHMAEYKRGRRQKVYVGRQGDGVRMRIEQARARVLTGDSVEFAAQRVGLDVEILKQELARGAA